MMTISKLLLVLPRAFLFQYAAAPPNVRPPTEQLYEQDDWERALLRIMLVWRTLARIWETFEISILVALSGYCPPLLARPILGILPASVISDPTSFTALTPTSLVGIFIILAGCILRAHCFGALGSRFTFELSIRPSHTLVTDGVYGVVRHPSYTGLMLLAVGWLLCLSDLRVLVDRDCVASFPTWAVSDRYSEALDCHAMMTGMLACVMATLLGLWYVVLTKRMDREDAMLEMNFGEEWRAWRKRVPYRVVPGFY